MLNYIIRITHIYNFYYVFKHNKSNNIVKICNSFNIKSINGVIIIRQKMHSYQIWKVILLNN